MSSSTIISNFRQLTAADRVDVVCALLRCCMPLEIYYVSTVLEAMRNELNNVSLAQAQAKANNVNDLSSFRDAFRRVSRLSQDDWSKLAVFLALLRSDNFTCGSELFQLLNEAGAALPDTITNTDCSSNPPDEAEVSTARDVTQQRGELKPIDTQLLIYTLAAHHPALTFAQCRSMATVAHKLRACAAARSYRSAAASPRSAPHTTHEYECDWQPQPNADCTSSSNHSAVQRESHASETSYEHERCTTVHFESCRFTGDSLTFDCRLRLLDSEGHTLRTVTRSRTELLDFVQRVASQLAQSEARAVFDNAVRDTRLRTQKKQVARIDKIEQLVDFVAAFCQFASTLLTKLDGKERHNLQADVFFAPGQRECSLVREDASPPDEEPADAANMLECLNLPLSSTVTLVTSACSRTERAVNPVFSPSSQICRVAHSYDSDVAAEAEAESEPVVANDNERGVASETSSEHERPAARCAALRLPDLLECNQPARADSHSRCSVSSSSSADSHVLRAAPADCHSPKPTPQPIPLANNPDPSGDAHRAGLMRSLSAPFDPDHPAGENTNGFVQYVRAAENACHVQPPGPAPGPAAQHFANAANRSFRRLAHASAGSHRDALLGRCFLCTLPGHYAAHCPYANAALAFSGLTSASPGGIPLGVPPLSPHALQAAINLGCVGLLNVVPTPPELSFAATQPSALAAAMYAAAIRPVGVGVGVNMGGPLLSSRGWRNAQPTLFSQSANAFEQLVAAAPQNVAKPLANTNGTLHGTNGSLAAHAAHTLTSGSPPAPE